MTQANGQDDGPKLLTPKEAAAFLRLNPRTVTRLARQGKLPAIKVGRRWRFRPDALEGWAETRRSTPPAPPMTPHADILEFSLSSLVARDAVICDLEAGGTRAALEEVVARLQREGLLSEGELFLKMLMEREELMSTNIVEGVAVPHPRRAVPGMFERSMVAVAIAPRGVDFGGGAPVRVFFVICAADDRAHLRILARLSRLLLETPMVERILGAKFPEEVTRVIAAEEAALSDGGKVAG